eukprot:TRINITY_DN6025_c0_g3_i1.p1 TRINITY_DN6025_c0_g3~~TRINITY_DN6025_c0_g3_i1.p1  ORF type:complete len:176 (+),score=50.86 TRINITY_DN6025_c0_g3_i1:1284-1811(+)
MNMYAGVLLLNCTNFGAFVILCSFMRIPVLRAAFTGNLDSLRIYGEIFMTILKSQSSKIHSYLTKCAYPIETYIFEAAASMFANNFALDTTEKLWDIIMENPELMMMRVGVAVFKAMEKAVLDKSKEEIIMMTKYPHRTLNEEALFKAISKTTIKQKDYDSVKDKILSRMNSTAT